MQSFFDGITVAEGKKRLGYIIKDQQDQGNLSERKIIPVFVRLDPLPDCQKNQSENKAETLGTVSGKAEMILLYNLWHGRLLLGSFIVLGAGSFQNKIQERRENQKSSQRIKGSRVMDKIQREKQDTEHVPGNAKCTKTADNTFFVADLDSG